MTFDTTIVSLGVLAEACLLLVLIFRNQWKKFPWFAIYICWAIVSDVLALLLHIQFDEHLGLYIMELSVDTAFQAFVLFELASSILRPVRGSIPVKVRLFIPVLFVMASSVCWYLAGFTVPANLSAHGHRLVIMQQTISLLRVVVFFVLVALSQFFSIGWRDRELQIATGLGFYSILSLVVSVLHTHQAVGPQYHWLDLVTSLGYLGTLAYWVVSFAQKEPEARKISPQMMRFLVSIGGSLQADRLALETAVKKKPGKYDHR